MPLIGVRQQYPFVCLVHPYMVAYRKRRQAQMLRTRLPGVPCRQIGACTLYNCDWQTLYAHLPRSAAIVTDPPYNARYDVTKTRRRPGPFSFRMQYR